MWVRVATFEGADPDKANAVLSERMASGEMTMPEGMTGALVLDDRDARKRKFLAFFDSKGTLTAAEPGFEQMGDTIPEEIRGRRTTVHHYEVAIYDGDIDNAKAARVSVLEGSADAIDGSLDKSRSDTLPAVRAIDGNVAAIGLVDRDNGRFSMITLWDSAGAMQASEHEADQLRERTAGFGGQNITHVARYEVATAQSLAGART
jgi:hypothetical protein